jgi:hypothetical protein
VVRIIAVHTGTHRLARTFDSIDSILLLATMPFVHITWLPKTCRSAAVRKEVAEAVIKVRRGQQSTGKKSWK